MSCWVEHERVYKINSHCNQRKDAKHITKQGFNTKRPTTHTGSNKHKYNTINALTLTCHFFKVSVLFPVTFLNILFFGEGVGDCLKLKPRSLYFQRVLTGVCFAKRIRMQQKQHVQRILDFFKMKFVLYWCCNILKWESYTSNAQGVIK